MRTLAERLIGKHVKSFDATEPQNGLGVLFTDGAAFNVNTSLIASITSHASASRVEAVTISEKEITLHLAEKGYIKISTDCGKHDVVEAFVFQDVDGTYVVENGA